MNHGQGESKMKLHTMNLVAAGSRLTDIFFGTLFKKSGVSITVLLYMTASLLLSRYEIEKKDFAPFRGARRTYLRHMKD